MGKAQETTKKFKIQGQGGGMLREPVWEWRSIAVMKTPVRPENSLNDLNTPDGDYSLNDLNACAARKLDVFGVRIFDVTPRRHHENPFTIPSSLTILLTAVH
jgi:hypothetical protein